MEVRDLDAEPDLINLLEELPPPLIVILQETRDIMLIEDDTSNDMNCLSTNVRSRVVSSGVSASVRIDISIGEDNALEPVELNHAVNVMSIIDETVDVDEPTLVPSIKEIDSTIKVNDEEIDNVKSKTEEIIASSHEEALIGLSSSIGNLHIDNSINGHDITLDESNKLEKYNSTANIIVDTNTIDLEIESTDNLKKQELYDNKLKVSNETEIFNSLNEISSNEEIQEMCANKHEPTEIKVVKLHEEIVKNTSSNEEICNNKQEQTEIKAELFTEDIAKNTPSNEEICDNNPIDVKVVLLPEELNNIENNYSTDKNLDNNENFVIKPYDDKFEKEKIDDIKPMLEVIKVITVSEDVKADLSAETVNYKGDTMKIKQDLISNILKTGEFVETNKITSYAIDANSTLELSRVEKQVLVTSTSLETPVKVLSEIIGQSNSSKNTNFIKVDEYTLETYNNTKTYLPTMKGDEHLNMG